MVVGAEQSIQREDLQDFSQPPIWKTKKYHRLDVTWSSFSAVNNLDSAVQVFNRSLQIEPSDIGTLFNYS